MNPPQSLDLKITEALWDHLDRERNKRQPTSKEELWDVLQEAWRTIPEDKKAHLRGFRLCWRLKVLIWYWLQPGLNCTNSVFASYVAHLDQSKHLFFSFPAIYKETKGGSGLSHSNCNIKYVRRDHFLHYNHLSLWSRQLVPAFNVVKWIHTVLCDV